jgi:hypothetical protein
VLCTPCKPEKATKRCRRRLEYILSLSLVEEVRKTMVTRIVVRITPAERASAAEKSNRDGNDDQLHHKTRDDDFDDGEGDYKNDTKNHGEKICLSEAADGGFCDDHSRNDVPSHCKPSDDAIDEGMAVNIRRHDTNTSNKRPLLLEDDAEDNGKKKRRRKRPNVIDLADVPPQSPIKSNRSDGSSKYQGVTFNKHASKWQARISVDGKQHLIGRYDNEEEAAIDYARAAYKYKAGIAGGEGKQKFIDLTDVPPQSPIKSNRSDGSSKYEGVTFNKIMNNWLATISVDGKTRYIGRYDNEEEAAIDYARAAFKYKAGIAGVERKQAFIDLTDVSPQSPIKSNRSGGSSKYQGVSFKKQAKKWQATMYINGKQHSIGYYDEEEEAAIDYARAVFKYSAEITQRGTPSARHTEVQRELCSSVGGINQTQNCGESRHHKPNPKKGGCTNNHVSVNDISSCSMDLVNKGGRIGIYLPDERKARIARFHAKRSTRVFKRRVSYDVRKTFADSRPRIKGRFVAQKSDVGGEDST